MNCRYPLGESRATISDQLSRICKSMDALRDVQTRSLRNSSTLHRPENVSEVYETFHFHADDTIYRLWDIPNHLMQRDAPRYDRRHRCEVRHMSI